MNYKHPKIVTKLNTEYWYDGDTGNWNFNLNFIFIHKIKNKAKTDPQYLPN